MDYSKEANKRKQQTHKSKKKKIKNRIGVITVRILFVVFILAIFAGIGGGLGILLGIVNAAPETDPKSLIPQEYTSIIYEDKTGQEIDRLHGDENREYVKISKIPNHLQKAVVSIEDERFYKHFGIDLQGIMRAVYVNIKNRSLSEGASTLTQQLIKNNVLTPEKDFRRKLQEQYLAVQYEQQLTKDQILEYYLNTIHLGHGINGVQAAAKRYFNKEVSDLTLAESAVLAATIQNPVYYSPINRPENNKGRQTIVLKYMLEQGYIDEAQYNAAVAEDVYAKVQELAQEYAETSHHSYFVDQIISTLAQDLQERKQMTQTQAYNMIYSGGLSIYATVDMDMQAIVDEAYLDESMYPPNDFEYRVIYSFSIEKGDTKEVKHYQRSNITSSSKDYFVVKTAEEADGYVEYIQNAFREEGLLAAGDTIIKEAVQLIPQPQSSMVIMDYTTGQVKAMAGGRGDKLGNRTLNRATQSLRQPGSAFKVLAAYAPALDLGKITPATVIDDVPYVTSDGHTTWEPKNWYSNPSYRGLSTVREGIRDSMNILAAKSLIDNGIDTAFDYLLHFGFTTLRDRQNYPKQNDMNGSLALGGITDGVSMLELTAAYGAIANGGTYIKPIFYTKVLDHNGNVLLENTPQKRPVIKETTAFLLTDMMKDVMNSTGGLARFKNVKMPIAGKTGTTTEDKDLVFAGYTPYYVASIWMGHDFPKAIKYNRTSYHNILWRTIMEKIHEDLPYKEFPQPQGIVTARICTESGKLAVEGLCDHDPRGSTIRTEYFAKGTEPTETCDVHIKRTVCNHSNLLANEYCPLDSVSEKVFIVRPVPYIPASANAPMPADSIYEFPRTLEGEYCNIHGPVVNTPSVPNNPVNLPESSVIENPISIDDFFFPQP